MNIPGSRHLPAIAFAVLIAIFGLSLPRCDDHGTVAGVAGLEDVNYGANVNDESLALLLAAPAVDGKGAGAVLDLPVAGTQVAGSAPMTFLWHAGPTARATPTPMPQWVNPFGVRDAFAHGELVSGTAYFLLVSSPADPKLLRAFTKSKSFTPAAAAWAKLKAAGGPLTAVVTTAIFDGGKLASDGGPFLGKPVTFTIAP